MTNQPEFKFDINWKQYTRKDLIGIIKQLSYDVAIARSEAKQKQAAIERLLFVIKQYEDASQNIIDE